MRPRLTLTVFIAAAIVACSAAAATPSVPQLTSFSVASVSFHGNGLRLSVAGSLDCTHHGDFHLNLWVYQSSTGALARASIPASRGRHPSKKRLAELRRVSACKGAPQPWSVGAPAAPTSAKHRTAFVAGPAEVCTVVSVGKSRRYVLQTNCVQTSIAHA